MVPICEDLVKKLVEWREHLKTKSKDVSPAAFIFRGRFGGPLDPQAGVAQTGRGTGIAKADIPGHSAHDRDLGSETGIKQGRAGLHAA